MSCVDESMFRCLEFGLFRCLEFGLSVVLDFKCYLFAECGGILPGTSGTVISPSYPNNYPANLMCIWQMQARTGFQISASFLDMNIETSNRCAKDYVSLQNGASSTSPQLAKLCGTALPAVTTYKSTGTTMRLTFKSDASGSGRGIRLGYNQTLQGINQISMLSVSKNATFLMLFSTQFQILFAENFQIVCETILDIVCETILDIVCETILDIVCETILYIVCETILDIVCETILDIVCEAILVC